MITVTILALSMPPAPMFQQTFSRPIDADDYEAYWRRLGACHIRRSDR